MSAVCRFRTIPKIWLISHAVWLPQFSTFAGTQEISRKWEAAACFTSLCLQFKQGTSGLKDSWIMHWGLVKEALGIFQQVQAGQPGKSGRAYETQQHSSTFANTIWFCLDYTADLTGYISKGSSILFKLLYTLPVKQTPLHLTGLANSINWAAFDQIKVQA